MTSRNGPSLTHPYILLILCILTSLVCPLSLAASFKDEPPVDAFARASDYPNLLGVISTELEKLKPRAADQIIPQIPKIVDEAMEEILDLSRDSQGKLILNDKQQQAREFFIKEFTKRVSPAGGGGSGGDTVAVVKPSDRLKPQDVNIRLFALQEWKKIETEGGRDAAAKEAELTKRVLAFAAEVCDFPESDPKKATPDETAYLKTIVKQVIGGQMSPQPSRVNLGLTVEQLQAVRDALILKAADLARTIDPSSTEFKDRLQQEGFAQLRKKLNLGEAGDLSDLQQRWIRSQIRQVLSLPLNPAKPDSGEIAGVSPETREKIFTLLKHITQGLFPRIPGLDADSRKLNLIKFIKDNKDKLGVAESVAEALVERFLKENPTANQPTTTTIPTTTTSIVPVTTTVVPITTVPFVLVPSPLGGHCLFRW